MRLFESKGIYNLKGFEKYLQNLLNEGFSYQEAIQILA
jgi:hypothetical protein